VRDALRDSLGKLIVRQSAERGSSSKQSELELMERVAQRFPSAGEARLNEYLIANPERGNASDWNIYLHLELIRKGGLILPVLTLSYDFPSEMLRLRVGLFALHDIGGARALRGIGYRFEAPENRSYSADKVQGEVEPGHHDYFHAQSISRLAKGNPKTQLSDSDKRWIPMSQPAFPLEAQNLLQLFACMLITIYGRKYVASAAFADVRKPLGKSLHSLECLKC
jgi:hypothetical protein